MKNNKHTICHSRMSLSGISSVFNTRRDPRLQISGMTRSLGFTLIELLVVVLIIGILSAIALPQYTKAVEKSRASEALINLKHALQARTLNYLENGSGNASLAKDIMDLGGGIWDGGSNLYCTKNFWYDFGDPTTVYAERCTPNDTCTGCQGNSDYLLFLETPFMGSETQSGCYAYTDLGYQICKSLDGQGFETNDQR